jgi:hypothetical protein
LRRRIGIRFGAIRFKTYVGLVFRATASSASLLLAAALVACGRPQPAPEPASPREAAYMAPPAVAAAQVVAGGVVRLSGSAPAGALVRLASPEGQAAAATADAEGRWSLRLAPSPVARLLALSARSGGRSAPGEGYLLLGPGGEAAVLRAGASALRLDRANGPGVAAIDLDSEGGALVSGWADAGTDVAIRLDGGASAAARSDEDGRFSLSLPRLAPGPHRLEAAGVNLQQSLGFDATPPQPLEAAPLRAQVTPEGLRAEWLAPGGGVQATLLIHSRSGS